MEWIGELWSCGKIALSILGEVYCRRGTTLFTTVFNYTIWIVKGVTIGTCPEYCVICFRPPFESSIGMVVFVRLLGPENPIAVIA
jgi:hypothetical protein